ncbi:hypothetical protein EZV62_002651 [Acer yangbiense]|uniref:Uncharacterized protein n=1 Tax=Acer yangbiense TaxID=1000413 RepID=A0A5C7IZS3_9ROSI|nr:hypothetical protein EZV62_002651 [Acer yangbiense]
MKRDILRRYKFLIDEIKGVSFFAASFSGNRNVSYQNPLFFQRQRLASTTTKRLQLLASSAAKRLTSDISPEISNMDFRETAHFRLAGGATNRLRNVLLRRSQQGKQWRDFWKLSGVLLVLETMVVAQTVLFVWMILESETSAELGRLARTCFTNIALIGG